jgi:hypothetical protein
MRATRILVTTLCAATLAACAGKKPPPSQRYTLGEAHVEYRDYSRVQGALCDAEPRKLADELGRITTLLEQFVSSTEAASQPEATAAQLELLREASKSLGPLVEIHRKNLSGLRACGFQKAAPFPELASKGEEVAGSAKARLEQAPALLAAADRRAAEQRWMEESARREATAKQTWCKASTAVGSGDLFFARAESNGRTQWLFCDGMIVEASSGSEPTLLVPEAINKKDRRRIQARRYLDAANSYPAEEIDRLGAEQASSAEE